MSKSKNEKPVLNKFHNYDILIYSGTAMLFLALIFFITVFTGVLSLGRASSIICFFLLVFGGIAVSSGRAIKKTALNEEDDFYEEYLTPAREKRKAKKAEETKE